MTNEQRPNARASCQLLYFGGKVQSTGSLSKPGSGTTGLSLEFSKIYILRGKLQNKTELFCFCQYYNLKKMDFCVKLLNDYESVNSAKRLLYDVYIHEMGWDFREDSPTGFYIGKDKRNQPILCDAFDEASIWFGAYKEDKIIGVTRAVQRNNTLGKLDLELYPSSELPAMKRIFRGDKGHQLIEVQRGAVAKDYRQTQPSVIQLLLLFVFSYAQEKGLSVICPTVFPVLETLFSRAGMHLVEKNFTYGEGGDEWPTFIFYCSSAELAQVVKRLKKVAGKRNASFLQERGHQAKRSKFHVV